MSTNSFLRLLAVPLVCSSLWATGQVSDPDAIFPALPPPPCDQTARPVMPFQDCSGALWITQPQQFVSTNSVKGSGCQANELPDQGNTCLQGNERRTVWMLFEVFPKAGGPTTKGAYAGKLRFRIVPTDVIPNALAGDEGNTPQGMTDYDFALFDLTRFNAQGDACAAIKAATAAGSPGSIQKACNYFGFPGATGMTDAGVNFSVDDNRYNLPIPVYVGQVFALAVDNFSLNAIGFTIDFDVEATSGQPSARIAPEEHGVAQASIGLGACRNILEVEYQNSLSARSVQPSSFIYEASGRSDRPSAVIPQETEALGSAAHKFALMFDQNLPAGSGNLVTLNSLKDRYGNTADASVAAGYIQESFVVTGRPLQAVCPLDTLRMEAISLSGLPGEGIWKSSVPGQLAQFDSRAVFIPSLGFSGPAILSYQYFTNGGCTDSIEVTYQVSEKPSAPAIAANGNAIYSSMPGKSEWMRGDEVITISRYDTLQNPTPGLYRVRSLTDDCASAWSTPFAVGVTAVRQVNDFSLAVYPNPAKNILHVDMMALGRLGRAEIELISPQGSRLRRYHVSSPTEYASKAIAIDGFASGMYTIRVATSGTLMAQKVFISQ